MFGIQTLVENCWSIYQKLGIRSKRIPLLDLIRPRTKSRFINYIISLSQVFFCPLPSSRTNQIKTFVMIRTTDTTHTGLVLMGKRRSRMKRTEKKRKEKRNNTTCCVGHNTAE
jgi:hypothetical protein